MLAFAADTDLLLFQKVSEETLAAIHAAGYDYQGGAVIPRPGKEETDMAEQETKIPAQEETQTAPPMKLDVSVRAIQPMGTLLGFATVKFYDCFVVEDFKILQTDKGLYVGMPSKPDKTSRTGYRDTAKPIIPGISGNSCKEPSWRPTRRSWDGSGRWPPHRSSPLSRASWRPVPNDLNRIKTKLAFNLTKRQLICFSIAGGIGVPFYLLTLSLIHI